MMVNSPLLRIEKLSKNFGGLRVIHNLSLLIPKNQIIGLIGPNGAGKTTLLNLLSGFEKPDEGQIFFHNHSLHAMQPYQIARLGIGRTFQIVKPFIGMTVLENAMIGALGQNQSFPQAQKNAMEILDLLELMYVKDLKADHLTLSDKKRLEIARALSIRPQLLLLDEVMAGLRPTEIDRMIPTLKDFQERYSLTIIMIEHHMRAIMACCDHVVVLHQGEKLAEDTPKKIQNHPEVIKIYLGTGVC